MPPNPQMQAVLDELGALGAKPIESLEPDEARAQPTPTDAVASLLTKQKGAADPEEVGEVSELTVETAAGSIPVRMYTPVEPAENDQPVLVYVHGGGWVIADRDTYDAAPRALANRAGCIVLSVAYRQGPEDPFPASHDDVLAVTRWVQDHAAEIGADPARIAIGGESAGGNMATATCLTLAREGQPLPVFQLLVYPVTDLVRKDYPSYEEFSDAKPLNTPMLEWFGTYEMTDPADAEDYRLSPLNVDSGELAKLPPAHVVIAEIDPLRDQGIAYAEKLEQAGVPVTRIQYDGVTHEFFGMGAAVDVAAAALTDAGEALRLGFAGQSAATA